MKYLKKYDGYYDVMYKVGDIVICSFKKNKNDNFEGYIDQNDNYIAKDPIYGNEYKIVDIYWYGTRYNKVDRLNYFQYNVSVENIKTGNIITSLKASLFTLKDRWIKPDEPMIGDYVLCKKEGNHYNEVNDYLMNNIGRNVGGYPTNDIEYIIRYLNVPKDLQDFFWNTTNPKVKDLGMIIVPRYDIIAYSPNKEDLEAKIQGNKYNL